MDLGIDLFYTKAKCHLKLQFFCMGYDLTIKEQELILKLNTLKIKY